MSLVKCHPRRHNSHVLSALYLLGKLGSGSQRVQRKAMNTVFGKHRKPRWYTKTAKRYPGVWAEYHQYPLHCTWQVNCGETDTEEKVRLTILSFSYISDSVCLEFSRLAFNTKVNWQLLITNIVPCTGVGIMKTSNNRIYHPIQSTEIYAAQWGSMFWYKQQEVRSHIIFLHGLNDDHLTGISRDSLEKRIP